MAERWERLRERAGPMLATAAVQLAVGYALVVGLGVSLPGNVADELKLFTVTPPAPAPPRVPSVPPPQRTIRREGAAAPPNLRSQRTELVAPPPVVPLVLPPPPVIVADAPGTGFQPTQGAAPDAGPGSGAGGEGEGTGSGNGGDGDGGAGRGETPPRHLKGRISGNDYPPASAAAGLGGTVSVRYTVETDGRVTNCRIDRSSGQRDLDETTCRVIEQRFRFRPSLDAAGRPMASTIVENHAWDPPPPDPKAEERLAKRRGFP